MNFLIFGEVLTCGARSCAALACVKRYIKLLKESIILKKILWPIYLSYGT